MSNSVTRPWTVEDLAERWGVTTDMVMTMTATRAVPYITMGARPGGKKSVRFRPDVIEAWEKDHLVVRESPSSPMASTPFRKRTPEEREAFLYAAGWDGVER